MSMSVNAASVDPSGFRAVFLRLAALAGAALTFAMLLIAVRVRWVPLESVDQGMALRLNAAVAGHPLIVQVLKAVSRLGSTGVLSWLVGMAALLLAVRRRVRLALYLVVTGVGALILDPTLKLGVGRLRPVVPDPVAQAAGNSFPSGHSLGSIVVYGALLLVFVPALPERARRPVTAALAVLVVVIGFTRLALGVHFLSDVLGAWCLGVAWLGITAYAFELGRMERGRRASQPLTEGLEPEAARDLRPAAPARRGGRGPGLSRGWAFSGAAVAWVLTFGVLCGIGLPLAKYQHGNGNILGDSTAPHWLAAHRASTENSLSAWGSDLGNTHLILAVGLLAGALALAVIRRWRPVVFLAATMFGELTLFLASSAVTQRARPDVPHLDAAPPTSSFPSGHVAATLLLYAAILTLVWPRTRAWWRWLFVAAAVLMPLWVGFSRLYRGMHHPTDLLGSVILAAGWLAAMIYFVRPNADVESAATGSRATPRQPGRK
jgi:undecaprenyl-diphosphatase